MYVGVFLCPLPSYNSTDNPIISEEIENNDGVKSLIEILNDCDHDLLRKVVRCLAQLDLTSGCKFQSTAVIASEYYD